MSSVPNRRGIAARTDRAATWRLASIASVVATFAAIAAADGVRSAVLTAVAGAALCATRARFAALVASAVVLATGLLLLTGRGLSD